MKPIFLHAGLRSGSTYLWTVFRRLPHVKAFFEPFHEDLETVPRHLLLTHGPDQWESGHPATDPYFQEYLPLLRDGGGIRGFDSAFSYEQYSINRAPLPTQHAYLQQLVDLAEADGQIPVFGFCRSLGRVEWLRQHFPDAIHVMMGRDPLQQWASAFAMFNTHLNAYFLTRPMLVAQYPGDNAYLQQIMDHTTALSNSPAFTGNSLYELFLRTNGASMITAASHTDLWIDIDLLSRASIYQHEIENRIRHLTGLTVDFSDCHIRNHLVGDVVVDAPAVHREVVPGLRDLAEHLSVPLSAPVHPFTILAKIEASLSS